MKAPIQRRRIKKADIRFVSLATRGKSGLPVLFKAVEGNPDAGTVTFEALWKADAERGELLTVVYAPGIVDQDGHFAEADDVRQFAYSHARNGFKLDIMHDLKPLAPEDAYVAESFIVRKEDTRFHGWQKDGADLDLTGAWAQVLKLESPILKAAARSGELGGVSMFGPALLEPVLAKADPSAAVLDALANKLNGDDIHMDKAELTQALDVSSKATVAGISAAFETVLTKALAAVKPAATETQVVAPVVEPKKPAADELALAAPVLKAADMGDPAKVSTHRIALERFNLAKAVDWSDPTSVQEYEVKLAELLKKAAPKTEDKKPAPSNQSAAEPAPEEIVARKAQQDMASVLARAAGGISGYGSYADKPAAK